VTFSRASRVAVTDSFTRSPGLKMSCAARSVAPSAATRGSGNARRIPEGWVIRSE
jgi:hypothetical protein